MGGHASVHFLKLDPSIILISHVSFDYNKVKSSMAIKRKKGIFFLTAGILLVIIAGAAFFGYQLLFTSLGQEEKAVIDDEVGKITQAIVDEILNSDTTQDSTQDSETAGTETGEDGDTSAEEVPQTPSQSVEEPNVQSEAKEDQIARVIATYENGFEKLNNEGDTILDRLVEEIKADYKALKAAGGGKVDLIKLGVSYTNKAKAYESSLDSSVTLLLTNMQEDLRSAGMPDREVKDYIKGLEAEYTEIKEKRQSLMFDKAKEYL